MYLSKSKIGVGIGSGGVYAAAGLGVLQSLEERDYKVSYVGGASAGAVIAALYFLEGNGQKAHQKLLEKLPLFKDLKFNPFTRPVSGEKMKLIIEKILDGRDWQDGRLEGACFGASYIVNYQPVILTKDAGLSLSDCVLASISFKMIEPIVELNGKKIAHGGDPDYLEGIRNLGADYVIGVSPNVEEGVMGKMAKLGNILSSLVILKKDYLVVKKSLARRKKPRVDLAIHPNLHLWPFVSPLIFNERNVNLLKDVGRKLMKGEKLEI